MCKFIHRFLLPADSSSIRIAIVLTPGSLTPWCQSHRGAWLRGINHTGELDSVVSITLGSLTPWYQSHPGLDSVVSITLEGFTPWYQSHRGACPKVSKISWRCPVEFVKQSCMTVAAGARPLSLQITFIQQKIINNLKNKFLFATKLTHTHKITILVFLKE